MGAPQYEQAGADIGGSGTTNYLAKWTGGSTLGNSIVFDNGTNVGIGTASPGGRLDVVGVAGLSWAIRAQVSSANTSPALNAELGVNLKNTSATVGNYTSITNRDSSDNANTQINFINVNNSGSGAINFVTRDSVGGSGERMRIDSSGNVGIANASPASYDAGARNLVVGSGTGNQGITIAGSGNLNLYFATGTTGADPYRGYIRYTAAGDAFNFATSSTVRATLGASSLDISSTSGYGLKLPATPGNGNANTLDSYQEGTRVLAAGDLSGWTYVTATQYWTLVGRTVTLHTVFTGGTSSATGGATIATPPLLTPLRIAAGAAANSAGTALGNGVCVVGPVTGTTGTVTTSNAISSSSVDKVITVTYETAGL